MRRINLSVIFFWLTLSVCAQVMQTGRFEMEKKNTDDFFTVVPAGQSGLIIVRDINKDFTFGNKADGDIWELTKLDTALTQVWQHETAVDYDYVFKAYDLDNNRLYLLFRDGEFEKSDYLLLVTNLATGDEERYEIENELELDLSHINVVDDHIILAGYVRYSPTVVSYKIGGKNFEVIPGFFKDRSHVIDLKNNKNGTFNVLTLEKDYDNFFLRLRTHSKQGSILFEREVNVQDDYRILSGKSTDFIDGNIALTGTYGGRNSYYAQGIYFVIVKPEGQDNIVNYISFADLEHFFDYTGEKRAERIKQKIKNRDQSGDEYKYRSRLLMHSIRKLSDGFLISAEVYDPRYSRSNRSSFYGSYLDPGYNDYSNFQNANYQYVRQPNRLVHVDDANHFEYLESVVVKLDKKGKLSWDQSFTIDEVEAASLEAVVDLTVDQQDDVLMLYRNEEGIRYKKILDPDSTIQDMQDIKLEYEADEIKHTYNLIGGTKFWYDTSFIVWGYHKVGNNSGGDVDKRRNVLFINKVRFD